MDQHVEGNDFMWQAYMIDPKHPEVCEFIKAVEPAIEKDIQQASELLLKDSLDQALAYLKRGAEKNKNHFQINLMKCYIHRLQKKFTETIHDLESMTTHLQKLPAEALSAEEKASRSVKINENYALLYNDIAQYLYQQKEYKDAVKIFQEAKKFKIDDVGILCNIGDCALVLFA